MTILNCNDISLFYGTTRIIENINLPVEAGSKLGIIGGNGAGKTTLFKIITGEIQPTSGSVYIKPGATIGFLSQMLDRTLADKTVYDAAVSPFSELLEMEETITELVKRMEQGDHDVIGRYSAFNEAFARDGGFEYKSKVNSFLRKLGFDEDSFGTPCSVLSGGQKTRLMLAVLLLREPDIILLDEPTNHLDIEATEWLEGIISASKKTFLIISHDRYFLDRVTDHTAEIEHGTASSYSGNYSEFRAKKDKLREEQEKHYMLQQREIKRLEDFIDNQRRWNRERNIIAAESRMKAIERMEKVEKPQAQIKKISFKFASPDVRSKDVLRVDGLSKSFPGKALFSNLEFEIHKKDRLFIIGKNGCGKSTLLKILTGRIAADSGEYYFGYSQKIGFYDQETQELDDSNTVIEEIWTDRDRNSQTEIRSHLARFGFYGEDIYKQVSLLSGGERARLAIAKLILRGSSLLMLDEPTNHLDISSKEVLENALSQFEGAILCVSHDRYFISSLADRILEIDADELSGGFIFFKGSYTDYVNQKHKFIESTEAYDSISNEKTSKNDFLAEKEKRATARRNEKQKETLEKRITEIEERLSILAVEEETYATDFIKLNEIYEEEKVLREELDYCYEKFFEIVE